MTKTRIISLEELNDPINQQLIRSTVELGRLIIFPTETVYGIGANALNPEAAQRIYAAKGRPSDNPLIVHISKAEDVRLYSDAISDLSWKLIHQFWPGPLTLILPKNDRVPLTTTGGLQTVAIRMPAHPIARRVIELAGVPLAAPSANLSGKPTSTQFQHVLDDFNGSVDIIIDGGPSEIGLESTVIDMTSSIPILLRPGFVTKTAIETVLEMEIVDLSDTKPTGSVKSPGMKYTHYKPQGEVILLNGTIEAMQRYVVDCQRAEPGRRIAVICESEYRHLFSGMVRPLGSRDNQNEIAHNLFAALRDMDSWGAELVFIHYLSQADLGHAIMNRLVKAAGYNVITLP